LSESAILTVKTEFFLQKIWVKIEKLRKKTNKQNKKNKKVEIINNKK